VQQVVVVEDSIDQQEIYRNMAALPGYAGISRRGSVTAGVVDKLVHYGDIGDVMGAACAALLAGSAGTLVFEIPHYWVVEVANVE